MSNEPSLRTRTFIIADDLTGACDTAVALSSRGASTEVLIDSEASGSADVEVRAICTETRDTSSDQAVEAIHRIAQLVQLRPESGQYHQIFKKIDSTFRGNTFHEIRAIFDAFPDHFAVVAPAYPAVGRVAVDGVVKVRDVAGETSIAVRDGLAGVGLRPLWIAGGQSAREVERQMSYVLRGGGRMVFCDAASESDLCVVIEAARRVDIADKTRRPVLWVGSAGLAHALAENLLASEVRRVTVEPRDTGSTIIFAGSKHPVTRRQIADLNEQMGEQMLSQNIVVVQVECGQTTVDEIRNAVGELKAETVSCMVMTGGDTAMLVCRALGVQSLRLHEEFEPGIPYATLVGGSFNGCVAIFKSGGFGTVDILSRIARQFSPERVAPL